MLFSLQNSYDFCIILIMQRDFIQNLIEWKDSKRRKPLILTGVRQCGKTYLLKEFGSEYFDNFCYINFESAGKYSAIFEYDYDVKRILREIELAENVKITAGKTLLIFDEIQECPKAITSLKYFCENLQELHLVCAGSLLGVAIKKENISFPVGKVNRMQLYPMSFKEYLQAVGEGKYIELFNLPVSAGSGIYLATEDKDPIKVKRNALTDKASYALKVSGDSMFPTYDNGDIVLVQSTTDISLGEIGIFVLNGEGYIKEFGDNELISHNKKYEPISLNDTVSCRGKVIGKLSKKDILEQD